MEKAITQMKNLWAQLQEQGAETLLWIANIFRSLGWGKAADVLQMAAGGDRALLNGALKGITLTDKPELKGDTDPNDPAFKAQAQNFENNLSAIARHFGTLQKYTKSGYYAAIAANMKKPSCTSAELLAIAQALPKVNPNPETSAPAAQAAPAENPATSPTIKLAVPDGKDLMAAPISINLNGKSVIVQMQADALVVNGQKFKIIPQLSDSTRNYLVENYAANLTTVALRVKSAKFVGGPLKLEADATFKRNDGADGVAPVPSLMLPPLHLDQLGDIITKGVAGNTFVTTDNKLRFERVI